MISVVSFDFFPMSDWIDFNFSPTDPWSENFELLGYETVNFIEGMGSILVFLWCGFIYILIVTAVYYKGVKCKPRVQKLCCGPWVAWNTTIGFLEGTFFEVMVCVSVSMRMLTFLEYLNDVDRFSIANQFVMAFILLALLCYILYFSIVKVPLLVAFYTVRKAKDNDRAKEKLKKARDSFKEKWKKNKAARATLQKLASQEANLVIDMSNRQYKSLEDKCKGLKKSDFKLYKPLYSGFRRASHMSLLANLFLFTRRLSLLYIAMFMGD